MKLGWHTVGKDCRLRYDKARQVVAVGRCYHVKGPIKVCQSGLYATERALDALTLHGPVLCRVQTWGETDISIGDSPWVFTRWAARHRKVVAMLDATQAVYDFIIMSLSDIAFCSNVEYVKQQIETGRRTGDIPAVLDVGEADEGVKRHPAWIFLSLMCMYPRHITTFLNDFMRLYAYVRRAEYGDPVERSLAILRDRFDRLIVKSFAAQ